MSVKMIFVHGTGARDVTGAMNSITRHAQKILGWSADEIVAIEWGKQIGPVDIPILDSLPPEYTTRGIRSHVNVTDLSDAEQEAAVRDLLWADPVLELRLLARVADQTNEAFDSGGQQIRINSALASVDIQRSLDELVLSPEILHPSGLTPADIAGAASLVRDSPELTEAADRAGDAANPALIVATARAVVVLALSERWRNTNTPDQPAAAYDGVVQEQLVGDVAEALTLGTRGFVSESLGKLLAPIATRIAVSKRADLMEPVSDFLRDIAVYLAHGQFIRDYLATEIRRHTANRDPRDAGPLVVLAHSLGGIAMVDLLSDPTMMASGSPLGQVGQKVDLLVTVGSQAPLLYLLSSLHSLRPLPVTGTPFVPWLNIYSREDLLSFCAERVWPGQSQICDAAVSAGVPFPMSHKAYWETDHVYRLIKDHEVVRRGTPR